MQILIPKLALRNLLGAGLRTWLNVFVLSLSFVAIIWFQGVINGMNNQATTAMIDAEYGGGQYWVDNYDPYDPLTLQDAHATLPENITNLIEQEKATAVLIVQGSIYPNGRIHSVAIKGIDPKQSILTLPAHFLDTETDAIPALIGSRMAKNTGLKMGDYVTVQWRDINGMFDAQDVKIVQIMKTTVQTIDAGQIWIPIDRLRKMTNMPNQATLVVVSPNPVEIPTAAGWQFKDHDFLLKTLREMIKSKSVGSSILYIMLMFLAMLAIFDTQVLSIFRRRKEMGTLMALGFTRSRVIRLFTMEGAMHGVLAAIVATIYGLPLLVYLTKKGWPVPSQTDDFGFAIGETIFPSYSVALVLGTTLLVLFVTTVVSYLPTRRITKLKPTDALRGKLT